MRESSRVSEGSLFVITGGPSTGKTTLLAELSKRGYKTLPEAARHIIESNLAKGLSLQEIRADEKKFQEDVALLKAEVESTLQKDTPIFLDRGMHDTIAYLQHYGFAIEDWVQNLVKKSSYDKVFLLEPLGEYIQDNARTEGEEFVVTMHNLLNVVYTKYGMRPISVPAMPVIDRANFILRNLGGES